MSDFWNPARVDELRRLWHDGKSVDEIRASMGADTRSVVIGKLFRLGLTRNAEVKALTQGLAGGLRDRPVYSAPRPAAAAPPAADVDGRPDSRAAPLPGSRALRILDEGFGGCRWPLLRLHQTADADTRFCCAPVSVGPWCATHGRRAYAAQGGTSAEPIPDLLRTAGRRA